MHRNGFISPANMRNLSWQGTKEAELIRVVKRRKESTAPCDTPDEKLKTDEDEPRIYLINKSVDTWIMKCQCQEDLQYL